MDTEPNRADDFARAMSTSKYQRKDGFVAGGQVARVLGLVLTGVGAIVLKIHVIDALQAAADGAQKIDYNGKYVIMMPFALVGGLLALVLGDRVAELFDKDSKSWLRWVAIVLVVIGFGLAVWMDEHFRVLGYHREGLFA